MFFLIICKLGPSGSFNLPFGFEEVTIFTYFQQKKRKSNRNENRPGLSNDHSKNTSPENTISIVMKTNQEPAENQIATGLNKSTVFGSTLLENETDYFSGHK